MDAGFIHVVEIGQYFMTKDTEEQFFARACREYTLPRSDESSQPKGWIQGNTRIGPVLEITTSYLYGKHGIEIRIWSLRKDNSQSWVRISQTLPAYCIPKVVRLKTGEVLHEKSYMSPRPPPKISLRHDHDWTRGKVQLGSTVDQQPEGKVVRQSRGEVQHATFSQLTQPIPKPICDRSRQPEDTQGVFVVKGETSRSHEIDEKGFHEKLCASDRSGD